jgi:PAS domain S-box-containing protein
MRVREREGLTVVTFPAADAVFAERVEEMLDRVDPVDLESAVAADLEARLRLVHPHVATRWRDRLAGFGERVLYVFRDGTVTSALGDERWIRAETTARVVTSPTGQYLDANRAAEDLFGAARERILEARAGSFTEPDARIEDPDALWRALRTTGKLHSLAVVCRPDGSTRSVEFVTLRDGDGPDRNVTYLRPVE